MGFVLDFQIYGSKENGEDDAHVSFDVDKVRVNLN